MSNTLVAYFSRADKNYCAGKIVDLKVGNTQKAVNIIDGIINADLFKIDPVKKYSPDYNICIQEAKDDKNADIRPKLKEYPQSMDEYDNIILCYPNYWGTLPMPVWTFLEHFDFSSKTIFPLCTNEGSGMGNSEADIRKLCPGAKLKKGLPLFGSMVDKSQDEIKNWLENNKL
jgi:flavodoxin